MGSLWLHLNLPHILSENVLTVLPDCRSAGSPLAENSHSTGVLRLPALCYYSCQCHEQTLCVGSDLYFAYKFYMKKNASSARKRNAVTLEHPFASNTLELLPHFRSVLQRQINLHSS